MMTHLQQALDFLQWLRGVWADPANWDGVRYRLGMWVGCRGLCTAIDLGASGVCPEGAPPLSAEAASVVTRLLYDTTFRQRVEWPVEARSGIRLAYYTRSNHPNPRQNQLRLLDAVVEEVERKLEESQ